MILVLDFIHIEPLSLVHSFYCFDSTLLIYGIARPEPILLVIDFALPDFLLLLQSYMRLGLLPLVYGMF